MQLQIPLSPGITSLISSVSCHPHNITSLNQWQNLSRLSFNLCLDYDGLKMLAGVIITNISQKTPGSRKDKFVTQSFVF